VKGSICEDWIGISADFLKFNHCMIDYTDEFRFLAKWQNRVPPVGVGVVGFVVSEEKPILPSESSLTMNF
jgi:hypothetical protein